MTLAMVSILFFFFPSFMLSLLSSIMQSMERGRSFLALLFSLVLLFGGSFFFFQGVKNVIISMAKTLLPQNQESPMENIHRQLTLGRGPALVVIGGGTGLSNMLRGLKERSSNITAIVTVSDDGGSSGVLRSEMGVLPPGDIRNVLVALADAEPLMKRLFQYRFPHGQGLKGHSFGNLFIATMWDVLGDFEEAIKESSRVLAVRGQVLPSSLETIELCAELEDGSIICGESSINNKKSPIKRVFLKPEEASLLPEAREAILEADAIILGPGSLYTSIVPNLLLQGMAEALAESKASKLYVCNVMTQPGETDGFTAAQHLEAVELHSKKGLVDRVLVNDGPIPDHMAYKYRQEGAYPVEVDIERLNEMGVKVVTGDLASHKDYVRHNPYALAETIMNQMESHRFKESWVVEHLFPGGRIL